MSKKKLQKDVKICYVCETPIKIEEKYVLIGTYNRPHGLDNEEKHFHFQCFTDWFNSRVQEKAYNLGVKNEAIKPTGFTITPQMIKMATDMVASSLNDDQPKRKQRKKKIVKRK